MRELAPGLYMEILDFGLVGVSPLNLYLIQTQERSLLIDTGFALDSCKKTIEKMLLDTGILAENLDVLITHNHTDHCGLAEWLADLGAVIYMNPVEVDYQYDLRYFRLDDGKEQQSLLRSIGITESKTPELHTRFMEELSKATGDLMGNLTFPYTPISPKDSLHYGMYHFEVIELCGHTVGQIGLFDSEHKLFFCADQLMTTIVPIVGSMQQDTNLLERYMQSMEYMKHHYEDYLILPSHYALITDIKKEVNRIVFSYLEKCDMMKHIVERSHKPLTIREVAMIAYAKTGVPSSIEEFNTFCMIMAKTFTCLEYLHHEEFVSRTEKEGILYWSV